MWTFCVEHCWLIFLGSFSCFDFCWFFSTGGKIREIEGEERVLPSRVWKVDFGRFVLRNGMRFIVSRNVAGKRVSGTWTGSNINISWFFRGGLVSFKWLMCVFFEMIELWWEKRNLFQNFVKLRWDLVASYISNNSL